MSEFRDIFARRVELEIGAGERTWRAVYDPSFWPVAWHVRAAEERLTYAEVIDRLARVLVEWDLTLDGQPLPCTEESLWLFPCDALRELYNRIFWSEMGLAPAGSAGDAADGDPEGKAPGGRAGMSSWRRPAIWACRRWPSSTGRRAGCGLRPRAAVWTPRPRLSPVRWRRGWRNASAATVWWRRLCFDCSFQFSVFSF